VLRDLARGKACILEGLESSTGAEKLESEVGETTGEGDESPLVGDAEESDHGSCEG
jgi:hypothetical protein